MANITSEVLSQRMRAAISFGWAVFSRKVGNGLTPVNKKASMQLQYAYVLQQLLPVITLDPDEHFDIELETGVQANGQAREVDTVRPFLVS